MEANNLAALNTYRYQIDQGGTLNPQQFVRYQALEAEFSRNHEGKNDFKHPSLYFSLT